MSIILKRHKRRQECAVHFGEDDFLIENFRFNPVHALDQMAEPNTEFDFYLDTGKDCYLLRLCNNLDNSITICKHDPLFYDFIIIVVKKQLHFHIDKELKQIVNELKKIRIPQKVYKEIVFKAFD